MKQPLLIVFILLFGCSFPTEQKVSSEPILPTTEEKSNFVLEVSNNCIQTNLSNQFDLEIDYKLYSDSIQRKDSCLLKVYVKDKLKYSIIDSIFFTSSSVFFNSDRFLSCDSMTSYTTKFKADREIIDNYFGDIVVADLNFDGNDDIAVINNLGGNGGPPYTFYSQTNDKKFVIYKYLTDSVEYFPMEIDKMNRRITTLVHASAYSVAESVYQLNKKTNQWKRTGFKILGD
jgi:hypothetical protein